MVPWVHTTQHPKWHLKWFSRFAHNAQLTTEHPYALQWATPSSQNCPFPWGIWTPSNPWFLWPTGVHNPNRISIGSAVFAGLTTVTDRLADQLTDDNTFQSVTTDCIYVCSTAMQIKKHRTVLPSHWHAKSEPTTIAMATKGHTILRSSSDMM